MGVPDINATEGVDTSMTLSAMSTSVQRSMVSARTIRTLDGRRWRKNSSVGLCCVVAKKLLHAAKELRGLPVTELLAVDELLHCSEAAVRLISSALSLSYGVSSGGHRRRSRTSVANSGLSELTMYSKRVFCEVTL